MTARSKNADELEFTADMARRALGAYLAEQEFPSFREPTDAEVESLRGAVDAVIGQAQWRAALRQEPAESDAHQMAERLRGNDPYHATDEDAAACVLCLAADFILAQAACIAELEQG
jgi:hypothetical protein